MSDNESNEKTEMLSEEDIYIAALTSALRKLYDSGMSDEEISLILNMNCN